jgi:hypothetical protein
VGPTKPPHVARSIPSQTCAAHGVALVPATHDDRLPCGAPDTGTHSPTAPETSHASHCPLQGALQQTPSTHGPAAHSSLVLHMTPCPDFARHVPESHQPVVSHGELGEQEVAHAPPTQLYGAHEAALFVAHVPLPSHANDVG